MEQFAKNPFGKKEKLELEYYDLLEFEVNPDNHLLSYRRRTKNAYSRAKNPNTTIQI